MMRSFSPQLWLGLAAVVACSLGCTMCNTEHMCDYGGVGGKWQRGNPSCGRVGSILSDAGANVTGTPVGHSGNYGDAWGLVEGQPTPAIESEIVTPDDGSILLGP